MRFHGAPLHVEQVLGLTSFNTHRSCCVSHMPGLLPTIQRTVSLLTCSQGSRELCNTWNWRGPEWGNWQQQESNLEKAKKGMSSSRTACQDWSLLSGDRELCKTHAERLPATALTHRELESCHSRPNSEKRWAKQKSTAFLGPLGTWNVKGSNRVTVKTYSLGQNPPQFWTVGALSAFPVWTLWQ